MRVAFYTQPLAPGDDAQRAARALYAAVATTLLSAAALALFFGGAGELWGPVNDLLVALTVLAMLPTVRVLARRSPLLRRLAPPTAAGLLLVAVGQSLLVLGAIRLETSFVTGTLGILPFLAWTGALAVEGGRRRRVSRGVRRWSAALLGASAAAAVGSASGRLSIPQLSAWLGPPITLALGGLLVALARDVVRGPPAAPRIRSVTPSRRSARGRAGEERLPLG